MLVELRRRLVEPRNKQTERDRAAGWPPASATQQAATTGRSEAAFLRQALTSLFIGQTSAESARSVICRRQIGASKREHGHQTGASKREHGQVGCDCATCR